MTLNREEFYQRLTKNLLQKRNKRITLSLTRSQYEEIDKIAKKHQKSKSEIVRTLIE